MNASSKDVVQILEEAGESSGFDDLVYATNLFTNKEPALPINCVTIFDTPGFAADLGLANQGYERPSIQVRVRNTKYTTGWNLIERIKNLLHGLSQQTVNGTLYSVIYCSSGPALLDWDDNGNCRLVCNFLIQRRIL
jgi:hypothetical protein